MSSTSSCRRCPRPTSTASAARRARARRVSPSRSVTCDERELLREHRAAHAAVDRRRGSAQRCRARSRSAACQRGAHSASGKQRRGARAAGAASAATASATAIIGADRDDGHATATGTAAPRRVNGDRNRNGHARKADDRADATGGIAGVAFLAKPSQHARGEGRPHGERTDGRQHRAGGRGGSSRPRPHGASRDQRNAGRH